MTIKKLKYQRFLEQFPNCPSEEFTEVEKDAYRWVHHPIEAVDFLPVNIISEPPPRMLNDSDKMCMGYGLSMFDTFENALAKYKKIFRRMRLHQKQHFKEDKGTYVALLELNKDDGIADTPKEKNYGHFTFHEYEDANLQENMKDLFEIFKDDEEFVN